MVRKADTRMYIGSGMNGPTLVGFSTARVALHRSACSRGYKLLREGADPRSLVWVGAWMCECLVAVNSHPLP
jgi:hypothetical protein